MLPGPERPRFTITSRELNLARKCEAEPVLGGRMPGPVPVRPNVQQGGSARRQWRPRLDPRSAMHDIRRSERNFDVLKVRFAIRGYKRPWVLHGSSCNGGLGFGL